MKFEKITQLFNRMKSSQAPENFDEIKQALQATIEEKQREHEQLLAERDEALLQAVINGDKSKIASIRIRLEQSEHELSEHRAVMAATCARELATNRRKATALIESRWESTTKSLEQRNEKARELEKAVGQAAQLIKEIWQAEEAALSTIPKHPGRLPAFWGHAIEHMVKQQLAVDAEPLFASSRGLLSSDQLRHSPSLAEKIKAASDELLSTRQSTESTIGGN